jgi:hypothetical protein
MYIIFQVVVDCPSTGIKQTFPCHRWLADDEDDKRIERRLKEDLSLRETRPPSKEKNPHYFFENIFFLIQLFLGISGYIQVIRKERVQMLMSFLFFMVVKENLMILNYEVNRMHLKLGNVMNLKLMSPMLVYHLNYVLVMIIKNYFHHGILIEYERQEKKEFLF